MSIRFLRILDRLATRPAARVLARAAVRRHRRLAASAAASQEQWLRRLLAAARSTSFGREHGFVEILAAPDPVEAYRRRVPVRDYEGLHPYVQRMLAGERDVLWPGAPVAYATTSGTTLGPMKHIPVTREAMAHQLQGPRDTVFHHVAATRDASCLKGILFFLFQAPEYQRIHGVPAAPITGLVDPAIPTLFRRKLRPTPETSRVLDWDEKVERMLDETIGEEVTLIAGVTPWVQVFLEAVVARARRPAGQVFPGLRLLVLGGVHPEPYRASLARLLGRSTPMVETYGASEGFLAFQDGLDEPGLRLNLDAGVFFEFVPAGEARSDPSSPREVPRRTLRDVEVGGEYAVVLTTNAGLWAYDLGDTVRVVSRDPPRVVLTGRTRQTTSAFGEHVLAEQVDAAIAVVARDHGAWVREFSVAPCLAPDRGRPHHEWFLEFERPPADLARFAADLDAALRRANVVYDGLVEKGILSPLVVRPVPRGGFTAYLRARGPGEGQAKVPRVRNDRRVADALARARSLVVGLALAAGLVGAALAPAVRAVPPAVRGEPGTREAPAVAQELPPGVRAITREDIPEDRVPSWWTPRVRGETLGGEEVRLVPGTGTGASAEDAIEAARGAARERATDLLLEALGRWLSRREGESAEAPAAREDSPAGARSAGADPELRDALREIAAGRIEGSRFLREATAEGRAIEHRTDGTKREVAYHRGWVMLRVAYARFAFDESIVRGAIRRLREEGRPAPALGLARALTVRDPDRFDLVRDLGELQRWAGRAFDALETLRRARKLAPGDVERASLDVVLRELEAEAAKDPWDSFGQRLRAILQDHAAGDVHLRLEPFDDEVSSGESLLYTAWSSRPFTYWGLEIARDGILLWPFHDEESGTQLGDDRMSESFPLDAGNVVGGRFVVLLAAREPRPWFREGWIDRRTFQGERSDPTVQRAIEEGRAILDTLERDLASGEVHAAWMEFLVVP